MNFTYSCFDCQKDYPIHPDLMLCPVCSTLQKKDSPLIGILKVKLTGKIKKSDNPISLLPVKKEFFPKIPVGNTKLWHPQNLQKRFGINKLFIKDDSSNPTGSLKDRASYLVAAFANKHNINQITVASTGNAGSSMAGIGANAGIKTNIFLPKDVPKEKMIQSLQYGANIYLVDGTYDDAYEISLKYSKKFQVMNRNTAYNPMTIEGKKTVSIEIFNDLGFVPDYIFLPVGDGVIISAVYKGFCDLLELGITDKIPKIVGVQSEGSNAIYMAFKNDGKFSKQSSSTIADSICVNVPRCGHVAINYLKKYQGNCITVSDQEILESQHELSKTTGLFLEPAAAASFAGLIKIKDSLEKNNSVVILATGNGLKDTSSAKQLLAAPKGPISSLNNIKNL